MEHTKEPWFADGDGVYSNVDCKGAPLAHVLSMGYDNDFRSIDARRIVACVNACAGVNTEVLEYNALHGGVLGLEKQRDQLQSERNQLIQQNAQLLAALRDVISWVPGREKWHTDEPIKAVERARSVISATVKESFTVDHQASGGAIAAQRLEAERASLFAESQRKQQLEAQVAELVGVLGGLLELHDNPAPFSGKTGEERMRMLENATAKRNAAIFAARAVIQKVRGGE